MGTLSPLSFHFYCIYFEVLGDFIFLPSAIESFRNKSSCYKEANLRILNAKISSHISLHGHQNRLLNYSLNPVIKANISMASQK